MVFDAAPRVLAVDGSGVGDKDCGTQRSSGRILRLLVESENEAGAGDCGVICPRPTGSQRRHLGRLESLKNCPGAPTHAHSRPSTFAWLPASGPFPAEVLY